MTFNRLNERAYTVTSFEDSPILKLIDEFIRCSSSGNIHGVVLEEIIKEMIKYHVADAFLAKGYNITFDNISYACIYVPLALINKNKNLLKDELKVTVTELPINKEGDIIRLCGKINK